jgi:putative transposase
MKTFKTRIYPDAKVRHYLDCCFGVRRFVWNWAVCEYFAKFAEGKQLQAFMLQKQLNHTLCADGAHPWLTEVNSMVRQEALKDLGISIKRYSEFQAAARRTQKSLDETKYKPHFQKKGKCKETCRIIRKGGCEFAVKPRHFAFVTTAKTGKYSVLCAESIGFLSNAEIKTCTFSRSAGRYWMSLTYEKTNHGKKAASASAGIDLGIKHTAVCYDSNGCLRSFDIQAEALASAKKSLDRAQKALSHTRPGSKRHHKALLRVQDRFEHSSNICRDAIEKFTTMMADSYSRIMVDDFSYRKAQQSRMETRKGERSRNRKMAQGSPYFLKTRLEQKCSERGSELLFVPKYTKTTQTCSNCGHVLNADERLGLSDRKFTCPSCGFSADRDMNSAINAFKLL